MNKKQTIIGDDGEIEELCPHGIGHGEGLHTCDGCCVEENKSWEEELREKWVEFHRDSELPGSAINTNVYFEWWKKEIQKAKEERTKEIKEMIGEFTGDVYFTRVRNFAKYLIDLINKL
jgi:hypothetical protein